MKVGIEDSVETVLYFVSWDNFVWYFKCFIAILLTSSYLYFQQKSFIAIIIEVYQIIIYRIHTLSLKTMCVEFYSCEIKRSWDF